MVQFCMASLLATMVLDDEAMVRRGRWGRWGWGGDGQGEEGEDKGDGWV